MPPSLVEDWAYQSLIPFWVAKKLKDKRRSAMFKIIIVPLALFISAMFMQACGNQAENSQPVIAPKQPEATSSPAQFNIGTYTTRVTLKDIQLQLATDLPAGGSYMGHWNFNFDERDHFSAIQGSQEMIRGQYNLNSGSGSSSQTISFIG